MPGVNGHNPQAFSGSWKNWDAVSGNINGTWRTASDVYVNHNGTWKQVWVRLTGPTNGSTSLNDVTATVSWTPGVGQEGFRIYRNGTLIGTAAANATTFTTTLPALQTTYTYTVSAFAGSTETAQISAGTARREVDTPTAFISLVRDWTYVNNDWDGIQIQFNTSCTAISYASGYEYSYDNGAVYYSTGSNSFNFALSQDTSTNIIWRAYRSYSGVTYRSAWSNSKSASAGRPLRRTARTDNIDFSAWRDKEEYYTAFGTFNSLVTAYGSVNTVVDSYQWRNLTCTFQTTINSSNRAVTLVKPSGNVTISPTSIPNGYDSPVYRDFTDGTYRCALSGLGWFTYASANKLNGTMRFNTRYVSQAAVGYSIS